MLLFFAVFAGTIVVSEIIVLAIVGITMAVRAQLHPAMDLPWTQLMSSVEVLAVVIVVNLVTFFVALVVLAHLKKTRRVPRRRAMIAA